MTANHPFESLLQVEPEEKLAFGKYWCGPEKFVMHEWASVAIYPGLDGRTCLVQAKAIPARSYRLVLPSCRHTLTGEEVPGMLIKSTREASLVAALAFGISDDTVAIGPLPEDFHALR